MSLSGLTRRPALLRAAVTSLVGAAVLLLAWRLLGRSIAWEGVHVSVTAVVLAVCGAGAFLIGRAWRFDALLTRRAGSRRGLLGATGASWGAGLVLPGPSADIAFVALARTRMGVGVARASGCAIIARILDAVSLAVVAVLAAAITSFNEPIAVVLIALAVGVAGIAGIASLVIPGPRTQVTRLAGRIRRLAPLALRAEAAIDELNSLPRWANLVLSTIFCRIATAVQYAALISMVGIHLGFWQTWFVLSIRTLLLTIPIQGIAGIGTGQAWWAGALIFEGIAPGVAVACGITLQALDLAVSLPIAGLASALLLGRRPADLAPDSDAVMNVPGAPATPRPAVRAG